MLLRSRRLVGARGDDLRARRGLAELRPDLDHLPSGERGTFERLPLLLLESKERPVWTRHTLTGFFVVVAAYTFFVAPMRGASRAVLSSIR